MSSNDINIGAIFEAGTRKLAEEKRESEKGKQGIWRGGNSGIWLPDSDAVAGKCPRLSMLRFLGYEDEAEDDKQLMFDGGFGNEDLWEKVLVPGLPPGTILLSEEDIPTSWPLESGNKVTGRPDLVICREEDRKPLVGIELKLICSLTTAKNVMFQNKPSLAHVIQASHYSWQLGVPFDLWYTSRVNYHILDWMANDFPRAGAPLSQHCEYSLQKRTGKVHYTDARGAKRTKDRWVTVDEEEFLRTKEKDRREKIKKTLPFRTGYQLRFDENGVVWVRQLDASGVPMQDWWETIVSRDAIRNYYEKCDSAVAAQELPPRVQTVEANGEKCYFSACDYCKVQQTCDTFEKDGFGQWLANVPLTKVGD